jgi:hypothetical protein
VGGVAIAVSTATVFIGWGKFLRVQVFALAEGLSTLRVGASRVGAISKGLTLGSFLPIYSFL